MVVNKWFGFKIKQGFYKKMIGVDGKKEILVFNFKMLEYEFFRKVFFLILEMIKLVEDLSKCLLMFIMGQDKVGEFYCCMFGGLFVYVVNCILEIFDDLYKIDDVIKVGFGWDLGLFEIWDIFGFVRGVELVEKQQKKMLEWISQMKNVGVDSFYWVENGKCFYYSQ